MPFVPVPKDLEKVKTKVAFNLTKRQLVCFGLGGIVGVPVYLASRGSLGNESAALLMISLMLPFFMFGIYEKDGQPLEKALMNFISVAFIKPSQRPYRTDNGYAALMRQAEMDKEEERIEKKKAGGAGERTAGRRKAAQKGREGAENDTARAGREAVRKGQEKAGRVREESEAGRENTEDGAGDDTLPGNAP